MGTSTAYGGPSGGTPLVPSWLGDADGGGAPASPEPNGPGSDGQPASDGNTPPVPPNRPPIPRAADPQRFAGARNSFTRFAGSGGSDRASLGRAVSKYVSTSAGGSRQAAQRMGASRNSGTRLLGFLADAQARGVREALRALDLESLAGRPITEIFVGLADYICLGAGTVDEGIVIGYASMRLIVARIASMPNDHTGARRAFRHHLRQDTGYDTDSTDTRLQHSSFSRTLSWYYS